MPRKAKRSTPDLAKELLTDPEGAALVNLGETRFAEVQREPDFPAPVWLGPRGKRHVRSELLAWALSRRQRPPKKRAQKVEFKLPGKPNTWFGAV